MKLTDLMRIGKKKIERRTETLDFESGERKKSNRTDFKSVKETLTLEKSKRGRDCHRAVLPCTRTGVRDEAEATLVARGCRAPPRGHSTATCSATGEHARRRRGPRRRRFPPATVDSTAAAPSLWNRLGEAKGRKENELGFRFFGGRRVLIPRWKRTTVRWG